MLANHILNKQPFSNKFLLKIIYDLIAALNYLKEKGE